MRKVRSADEMIENYVSGITVGMFRYKRFLVEKRNFKEAYAIDKSCEYGVSELHSACGDVDSLKKAEASFREIAEICSSLADYCKGNLK